MNTKTKIKSTLILEAILKLKSIAAYCILLLFPVSFLLNAIFQIYNNNQKASLITFCYSFLTVFILILILFPFIKKGISIDNQKNIFLSYSLADKILLKKQILSKDYTTLLITEEPFEKQNKYISVTNASAAFVYPVYHFTAIKNQYKKVIYSTENPDLKNQLTLFLEKESNLKKED
ncbi:hypothetical protein [Flavobacterium sp. J27]|uniref:hypothetical protein n=1 Tax=Flavobacterium sp. J27 TaxID=2060419 RepID=UPI001032286F|nr:hypothetical protein [Flavobacterium sp. J27]